MNSFWVGSLVLCDWFHCHGCLGRADGLILGDLDGCCCRQQLPSSVGVMWLVMIKHMIMYKLFGRSISVCFHMKKK